MFCCAFPSPIRGAVGITIAYARGNLWPLVPKLAANAQLYFRFPALLVFASPTFHRFVIADDFAALCRIELKFALNTPRDVGELKHSHRYITDFNGAMQLFAFGYAVDEVLKVRVGHGIAADQIAGGSRRFRDAEFIRFPAVKVIDLVAISVDQHGALCSKDAGSAVAVIHFHAVAAAPIPGDGSLGIFEVGDECVVELPVILELVATALC